mgnify:CR=1 FL=1
MFTNLSFFIDDCLRAENDKSIFALDKKKALLDLVIVFLIIISAFTIVGYFFKLLNSIHYLFYMFFISINLAYSVMLYLGVKTNIYKKKLHVSLLHALFMRIMVVINLTSLQGVVLSFLVYQPFLGLIDQLILLLLSISTSVILILRAYNSSVKHHDIQNNLFTIIILTTIIVLIMYVLQTSIKSLTILIPTIIVLVLLVLKNYFIPPMRLSEKLRVPVVVVTTIVLTASVFYVFSKSNQFHAQDDPLGLYYYHLNEEIVCQPNPDMARIYPGMMMNDGFYFFQTSNTIQVFNSDCSMVDQLDVQYPFTIFELEGDVSVLSHIDMSDDLEEDYKAYTLYIFNGETFVQDRLIYQYGDRPSELFIYNGHLSYALNHDYHVIDGHYIPYIKSFEGDSPYGQDYRIDTDIVHYQDNHRLIFQSNGLEVLSRPEYGISSILYSNGYILKFGMEDSYYSTGDTIVFRPMILTVEEQLNQNQENQILLSRKDLGITNNIVQGFHYLNKHFYIYVNQSMYIFNKNGKLIEEIKRIPYDYQFVGDDLYILSQSHLGAITKIDLSDPNDYLPKKQVYLQNGDFHSSIDTSAPYAYNFHTYPIYIHYLFIIFFACFIVVDVEFRPYEKDH